jgi:hypothetical protein
MRHALILLPLLTLALACSSDPAPPAPQPTATSTQHPAPTATEAPTATPQPTPTPEVVRRDIRATRLSVPAVGIDAEVLLSQTIPYTYVPPPGCPPRDSEETETVTVPNQGIATPEEGLQGLENKAWIYGHSRWLGAPGVFLSLQDLDLGDEAILDGVDRNSGESLTGLRFVVDGFYLADTDSGELILNAETRTTSRPNPSSSSRPASARTAPASPGSSTRQPCWRRP